MRTDKEVKKKLEEIGIQLNIATHGSRNWEKLMSKKVLLKWFLNENKKKWKTVEKKDKWDTFDGHSKLEKRL